MIKQVFSCVMVIIALNGQAQPDRWQQRVKYKIDANLDVVSNKLTGVEQLQYFNNSPDTLSRVFFHTYWNAFQPNSSMDVRSRELGAILIGKDTKGNDVFDRYKKVYDRISKLGSGEVGYQNVQFVKLNGRTQKLIEHETILEVVLDKPVLPKSSVSFKVAFEAQVPKIIRRSGRDSDEGIKFSMGQWYPKMVEYDDHGWNANQYVGFEFYGVWGDYDVKLSLDRNYMVGASGTLQNPAEVGFGYEPAGAKLLPTKGSTLSWHFVAQNVHDFAWAADPTYKKITRRISNGPLIHVIYKAVDSTEEQWQRVADTAVMAYPLMAKWFGSYAYKNFSIIQGGDGGMEYAMATLMRTPSAGTAIHEWLHSWFQGMMGSNESLYPWMDEGFTNYATSRVVHALRNEKGFAQASNYASYFNLVKGGWEEPAATPADHFTTNYASAAAAYHKGATFVSQLGYIIGDKVLDEVFLEYYKTWRFKHPNPNDFIRVAEKKSNMALQWYKDYWINTTKTVDYAIDSLWEEGGKTKIRLRRVHDIPMPIDVQLTFKDGSRELHYIPLNLLYGTKPIEDNTVRRTTHEEWKWTHPTYIFETNKKLFELTEVNIDPSMRMADMDRKNNLLKIEW